VPGLQSAACARISPLPVPRADTLLDEIIHPLLAKATERFAGDETPQVSIPAGPAAEAAHPA